MCSSDLMAMCEVLRDRRPTYLLSGINSGANLAEDVSYSGTIAAAMEGTLLGIRSLAISQLRGPDRQVDFAPCERYAPDLIRRLLHLETWPGDSLININRQIAAGLFQKPTVETADTTSPNAP